MTRSDDWSPDEPLGTEAFEQGDEAFDDASRSDSDLIEAVEQDPSLNPTLQLDERELEEAGAEFDDPERLAVLDGGIDDPDGVGKSMTNPGRRRGGDEGWDLDADVTSDTESDVESGE